MNANNYSPQGGFVQFSNLPCHCGSGKQYNDCHRDRDQGWRDFMKKLGNGEIPVMARVVSESGEPGAMEIGDVWVSQNGQTRMLSEGAMTLKTNSIEGDKTPLSAASISFPIDGSASTIYTAGNATIGNGTSMLPLLLHKNVKKMKAASPTGGFAIARICKQGDTGQKFFDFLFGVNGQAEVVEDGRKNRSHVAFLPDGNGKFLRLDGENCEITTEQSYCASHKLIVPRHVKIRSSSFLETLVAEFETNSGAVELARLYFI